MLGTLKQHAIFVCAAAMVCVVAGPAVADDGVKASQREKGLERRVNELEQELRIMKNRLNACCKGAPPARGNWVKRSKKKVSLELSGQVNRAVMFNLTRSNTEIHHVDNDASSSRMRLKARANAPGGWKIEARIEIELENNASDAIDDTDVGTAARLDDLNFRKLWVAFKHPRWGRVALGREDTATNGIVEIDLSSTTVVLKSEVETMGGDLRHLAGPSAGPGSSGRQINFDNVSENFDGLSRRDLIRYDSPKFFGFWVSVSHANRDLLSAAIRFKGNPFGLKDIVLAMGFGFDYVPGNRATSPGNPPGGPFSQYGGSISVLHKPSGISLTFAASTRITLGNGPGPAGGFIGNNVNPYFLYAKLGWQTKSLLSWGRTAFAVDAHYTKDLAHLVNQGGSESSGIGFAVVQKIDSAETELYVAYRVNFLEFGNDGFSTLHIIMTGARMKF